MAKVSLKDRFDIDDDMPMPHLDSPTAKAFKCVGRAAELGEMVALVCDPRIPMRVEAMEALRGFTGAGLMTFVDSGVVGWPANNRRQPVLIMEPPMGERVFETMDSVIEPLKDEQLIKGFLTPAINTLRELSARSIAHRNIRPDNLFYSDTNRRLIILGECLSAPPGYNQPLPFEALECAMADETGRGEGVTGDDLFALGVTLLSLLIGRNPVPTIADPHRYVFDRINLGSYANIVGTHRIQMNIIELLRGLLSDDTRERWTVREVQLWLGGRRLTPKQVKLPLKAQRPLTIGGMDHENVRSAAYGFARNWTLGGDIARGQDFDNWVRRSLGDEVAAENLNKVAGSAEAIQASPKADDAVLVTKICLALDPAAPVRYKGFSTHIDGIGPTLAMGFNKESVRENIAGFITGRFLPQWMGLQSRTRSDVLHVYTILEKLPELITQTGPGFGIERCLYELNPYMHCLSSMIEHLYITKAEEMIPALEAVALGSDLPPIPMDRHVAAFLASRSEEIGDRILRPLAALDEVPAGDALKVLRILARVQTVYRNAAVPGLCAWFQALTTPAVNSFHNLRLRQQVEVAVAKAAETGMLHELLKIFDDARVAQRDRAGYLRARQEYAQCATGMTQMSLSLQSRENLASELGEQVAAVISGVVGSVCATGAIIFFLM
ncbi:MAG: serine/threonine-protein kinase [Proteobacteria bacterium]|nr:serine/threonine-protein kinase [Pseudomonadota bacterium]